MLAAASASYCKSRHEVEQQIFQLKACFKQSFYAACLEFQANLGEIMIASVFPLLFHKSYLPLQGLIKISIRVLILWFGVDDVVLIFLIIPKYFIGEDLGKSLAIFKLHSIIPFIHV